MFFNVAINKGSDVASSSARLVGGLGNRELVQQFVKNLFGLGVLRLGRGCVRGSGLVDVNGRHGDRRLCSEGLVMLYWNDII